MGIRENPVLKRVMEAGEQQVSRLASQLLSNERFVAAIQNIVSRTLEARTELNKNLERALASMNLPTHGDIDAINRHLDDLDRAIVELDGKLSRLEAHLEAGTTPEPAPKKRAAKKKA